ncbi:MULTISPECIES: hypothetical protein [Arthrobacter]|uniref:Acetone carboxylase n=2 Tax=Arthrobacter TaxID=1663 RepID=A0ABU9KHX9_9MICC|nr:hypothetical protein [Arthrobacter sp. YJM1]MDP5225812.1 hypothetical protein [Arthrobacter sp. YJM1]
MSFFDALARGGAAPQAAPEAICSRKGCRAGATWSILWNNPRIHPPERRKIWLACDEHRGWLQDYLQQRAFWKDTVPFTVPADATPSPSDPEG